MSNGPLVFVTGATGHVGFAILVLLLKKGYRVRVSSRNLATAQKLKDLPSVEPYAEQVSFVEIPDVFADDAYDDAVKDVDYVVHVASPLPDDSQTGTDFDVEQTYIAPAIQGNLGLLRAAQKSPTVKRVVITSSVAILTKKEGRDTVGPDDLAPVPEVKDIPKHPLAAYAASKLLANAAAEEFVKTNELHFDVVHILPSYVQGRNEPVASSRQLVDRPSSNQTMIKFLLGHKDDQARPNDFVLLDDVAAVHVAAVEAPDIKTGERFIAAYPRPVSWVDVEKVVKKLFPGEVESGILPLGGECPDWGLHFDSSKTTERLGLHFHGIEDMVKSLVGQYVELVEKETRQSSTAA
ncbi:putative oxidoreductase [Cladophialophora carrionii]|uniref:Putative oxidoreductase n=1 Tax=Cladophialophora carrionii TaxID=86049 RepID=A0A1C1CQG3_9EURO|nr:putative oxidoreductase [Cladophialophora carrionii]